MYYILKIFEMRGSTLHVFMYLKDIIRGGKDDERTCDYAKTYTISKTVATYYSILIWKEKNVYEKKKVTMQTKV